MLLLHIASAIVGFGGVIAHSAYHARAFGGTAGDASVLLRTTQTIAGAANYAIYGVFALGIVLIAVSDGDIEFSEGWISGSFLVWFLLVGVAHGLIRPTVRSLSEAADAKDPGEKMTDDPAVVSLAKRLALGEGLFQLLLVVALVLMIWQPGS